MRRTYRSKKDTGGAIDHRDVLLNKDEKSSAFDAFYIQNIKQTKRELSCVGTSNVYGDAAKKVRKRKYVKRIVKEVENVRPRESISTSTYLTPDKSIRVNKILDPFDELLNSSSTGQATTAGNKNMFLSKKASKTYNRKKLTKIKKLNYSSDNSSDSDKENTSNPQTNMTDIGTHELLVERESSNSSRHFDESINKIVNNLSLINNFKRKNNSTFNTSYKYHRNRLTRNGQSPILQKSPLCSTPFKEKYRGKSIYNFSPITTKETESPNNMTIQEENNDSNRSIVFLCKEKVPKLSKEDTYPLICLPVKDVIENSKSKSLIYEDEIYPQVEGFETENLEPYTNTNKKSSESEQSVFQVTEVEPFLGFSTDRLTESVINSKKYLLKCTQECISQDAELSFSNMEILGKAENMDKSNYSGRERSLENISGDKVNANTSGYNSNIGRSLPTEQDVDQSENENDCSADENDSRNYNDKIQSVEYPEASFISKDTTISDSNNSNISDKESMYDTCESEQSSSEENKGIKEPKVAIERMNDSIFIKYYEKLLKDKEESLSESEKSFSDKNRGLKVPKVVIERISDSVFIKNYEKMLRVKEVSSCDSILTSDSYNEDEVNNRSDETSYVEMQGQIHLHNNSNENNDSKISSTYTNTESDFIETQPTEIIITDSSTIEDVESNDETSNDDERHVSFVTTRRRNEITNDSMFIFNNSYGSSSTDCDKTVLSNKAKISYFEKSDVEIETSVNNARSSDANDYEPCEATQDEDIDRIERTRESSRQVRHSEIGTTDMDCSVNEVTMIGIGQTDSDETINESTPEQIINTPEARASVTTRKDSRMFRDSIMTDRTSRISAEVKPSIVLQPGKKWERSLSIYRRMTTMVDHFEPSLLEDKTQKKGRKYRQSVISTMEMQDSLHNASINSRRSTFISKPSRPTIRFVKDPNNSRISLNTTEVFDDLQGFLTEECDDTVIELSKLSLADSELNVTVLDNFHETSGRVATARDYVLRRCNQTEPILFDECYPETVLKNCHKIGEGVYGEVFLWRGRDGRARVMKIVPIAGTCKVNGEQQKDYHEVISEIVIAMELSALRAPIADIDRYFDEGKDIEALDLHAVENATDVFNEVLAVRCVQGPYPSRLLDLWELYDECKGSENDSPAALPADQAYMVLELANAGQDLESYHFTGAQQAHALFQQIAFGLAVGEEAFQFEHRDLHWGNVLIAPTEQKFATFVLRGRTYRVPRGGVAATIIDYSLSRITLPLAGDRAALYNDLATDEQLFDAVGDYQFEVYRLMRDKLGNEWKNFEPYTNILWLHYTVDKMITALRYKRPTTKIHKHYIEKLKGIKNRILNYKSATEYVLTDIEI